MTEDRRAHTLANCSAKLRLYAQAWTEDRNAGGRIEQWRQVVATLPERLLRLADEIDAAAPQSPGRAAPDLGAAVGSAGAPHADTKVLLVEDDPDTRELTRLLLEDEGWTVIEAADGPPALERLAREPVGLVLMDARLATVSGASVVTLLRHCAGPNQHIPVIGLSASSLPEDRQAALRAGMNDWLVKPLLRKHVRTLRKWVE